MPRELTTPTVLTILFLALTGIYGFLRFSHENVLAVSYLYLPTYLSQNPIQSTNTP